MITVISGTNRPDALTPHIAQQYLEMIRCRGPEKHTSLLDLRELPRDFLFSGYQDESPIAGMQDIIDRSSHLVWIFPEYNGSFPGVLKFFLDGLRYPDTLPGKKGVLLALGAGSQGGALGMSHLNDILSYMGMFIGPMRIRIPKVYASIGDAKTLEDENLIALMREQIDQLLRMA